MGELLLALQLAIAIAFGFLAVRTAVSWIRQPDRRFGYLTLALCSLALLILIAPILGGSGAEAQTLTDVALVLFLLSGYALAMFRDSFVPIAPRTRNLVTAGIVLVGAFGIVEQLPADSRSAHGPLQSIALTAVLIVWALCILEPIIRFWIAARGRHAVEAARLRALSAGYAGTLFVVMFGTFAPSLGVGSTLVTDLITLAVVPILYVSFAPPAWLRRFWRQPEEDQFRKALHDLLLYSPDRRTLAQRALGWALRLVGGEGAFVIDSDRSILAADGIEVGEAEKIAKRNDFLSVAGQGHAARRKDHMLIVPLDLQDGRGAIVIVSGRLTSIFGDDELNRLVQYAVSISAGLDRVALNERIRDLEKAKSDFLNIASHELRGPMTIIKGYLTMFEAGSMGELSPKANSVLPLLILKSDEINWMLEQMLETSRLEEGRLELNKKRCDVVEITDMAIDGVKMLLRGHDLKVDEPTEPVEADVDRDRFQMVIRNLLSNAAKYSPAGTDITVRIQRENGNATVAVIDHGVGISTQDQANLFTRFGRIQTTQHVQGTGLGLWLSREIARMHDGDLTVQSALGSGSTFVLAVPLRR
ncbi:MAG TPA: HAMP domain-containing sensor histidine kinase [Candidatus Dormibacteraeota bacterium]|nr:HAMP domain-containing sensor histidine kinase [Candidatus Dormibacteraeota bacterium]